MIHGSFGRFIQAQKFDRDVGCQSRAGQLSTGNLGLYLCIILTWVGHLNRPSPVRIQEVLLLVVGVPFDEHLHIQIERPVAACGDARHQDPEVISRNRIDWRTENIGRSVGHFRAANGIAKNTWVGQP